MTSYIYSISANFFHKYFHWAVWISNTLLSVLKEYHTSCWSGRVDHTSDVLHVEARQELHKQGLSCPTNNVCGFAFMQQLHDGILYSIIYNFIHTEKVRYFDCWVDFEST